MNGCSFQQILQQNLSWYCLNTGKGFFLKPTKREYVLLKNSTRDFQNSSPFEKSACFYVTIIGNFEHFQYFNFETNFPENENLFKKLEYHFLVESTKIENTSFLHKATITEAKVKAMFVTTDAHIHTFCKRWNFFLTVLFPCEYP